MHRAKAFFFVCLGILCLVAAYQFGASNAAAQAPGNPVVGIANNGPTMVAITANGDLYSGYGGGAVPPWHYVTNIFSGSATSAQPMSMGQLKAKYATPKPTQ